MKPPEGGDELRAALIEQGAAYLSIYGVMAAIMVAGTRCAPVHAVRMVREIVAELRR